MSSIHKTPSRRQLDPIECGAVALGIALEYFGRCIDNETLRKMTKVSREGADAYTLVDVARKLGLLASAHKVLLDDLKNIKNLSILFFDNCHFVLYEGYKQGQFYLNDPARGRYALSYHDMHKRFSHIAIELKPSAEFVMDEPGPAQKQAIAPKILMMYLGLIAGISFVMFSSLMAIFLDFNKQDRLDLGLFLMIFSVLTLTIFGVTIWQGFNVISRLATKLAAEELSALNHDLMQVSPLFFDDRPFFYLAQSYISSNERAFKMAQAQTLSYGLVCFILVIFFELALLAAPILVVIILLLSLYWKELNSRSSSIFVTQLPHENEFNLELALNYSQSLRAMGQGELVLDDLLRQVKAPKTNCLLKPIFLCALASIIVSALAAQWWLMGLVSASKIYEIILLMVALAFAAYLFRYGRAETLELYESLKKDLASAPRSLNLTAHHDDHYLIKADKLGFAPKIQDEFLFTDLSFAVAHHEILAIVGAPFIGVSTLMKILAGLEKPSAGALNYGAKTERRLHVALINEDSDLMAASLKDNLSFYNLKVSDKNMSLALQQAAATEIFHHKSLGLHSHIGAHGLNLGPSEIKRILLAQALAHKADALILDDFFIHLDEQHTKDIFNNLRKMQMTTIFNSYNAWELALSDRVLFIKNRSTIISATHDELMNDSGYRSLINQNSKEVWR